MPNADQMLEHAAANAETNAAPNLSPRPGRKVAVLSCMDARIAIFPLLGLQRGDAHIIRNAGGLATDSDGVRVLEKHRQIIAGNRCTFPGSQGGRQRHATGCSLCRATRGPAELPS